MWTNNVATLSASTLYGWKVKYLQEIANKRHRRDKSLEVTKLSAKKRGRPLLLGEEMDEQVKVFLKQLCENSYMKFLLMALSTKTVPLLTIR